MKQAMQVLTSSETNEWYTPTTYIAAARIVMRGIDLDPASTEEANKYIQADKIFTKSDDGLKQEWFGRVWLNPPYGKAGAKSNQEIWANKLLEEYKSGRVTEAILLTKTVPGYVWWDDLFTYKWPGPVCITYGRISFLSPQRLLDNHGRTKYKVGKSKTASSFWYIGPHIKGYNCFSEIFGFFGRIISPERG